MRTIEAAALVGLWPNSVKDWADLLGAVSTFAAVVVALAVAGRDGRRQRRADTWRQASQVSAWKGFVLLGARPHETGVDVVLLLNSSDQPIWDVCVSAGAQYGAAPRFGEGNDLNLCVTMIPPGRYRIPAPKGFEEGSAPGMSTRLDAAISFRDADGNSWRRDAAGQLKKTRARPLQELKIEEPPNWVEPYISQVAQVVRVEDPVQVTRL